MQSDAPSGHGSSAPRAPHRLSQSPAAKRRRPSGHAAESGASQPHFSNATLSSEAGQSSSTRSPQRYAPSREGDMQRSSTPPESGGSIRYTRTGRVSKASKGQRIHHCDECGRTYTRAEHLRRHQQNHKPGAFPCDISGCSRSFYREDLLARHKARHNDPLDPPTRRQSIASQTSGIDGSAAIPAQAVPSILPSVVDEHDTAFVADDLQQGSQPAAIHPSTTSRQSRKSGYLPLNELHPMAVSVIADGAYPGPVSFSGLWAQSPPYSPTGYDSPPYGLPHTNNLPYYSQPQFARGVDDSSVSFYGRHGASTAARSPMSAGSSTSFIAPQPGQGAHFASLPYVSSCSSSERGFSVPVQNVFSDQPYIQVCMDGSLKAISAKERDDKESGDLKIPTTVPTESTADTIFNELAFTNEQRYLAAYWTWIHPLYPILHKPTFHVDEASPLLRAAMLALGAYMLHNSTDMQNARIVHERCMKILQRRNINGSHTYRVCDTQAIVLIEIYAIFKARRPLLQLSKPFLEVYNMLANDHEALSHDTANDLQDSPMHYGSDVFDEFVDNSYGNLAAKCKHRLLLACYILDQHHAALFGRTRSTCMALPGISLPFPRPQMYWDALPEQQADIKYQHQLSGAPCYDEVFQAINAARGEEAHDAFRSQLILACIADPNNDTELLGHAAETYNCKSSILAAHESSPRTQMAYHTQMLCKDTPVRELLSVAGESWCMAEKLNSQSDYSHAQSVALEWAKAINISSEELPPVQQALQHARCIFSLHRKHPKSGLLFHEWAVYLAAVVYWARAYVASTSPRRRPRLSIPSPTQPRQSIHELDKTVYEIVIDGGKTLLNPSEARSLLLWAKAQIEKVDVPHNCGLTNGALDVLGKLATRGTEDGWFGS